jgi:sulfatase modifying factor 1
MGLALSGCTPKKQQKKKKDTPAQEEQAVQKSNKKVSNDSSGYKHIKGMVFFEGGNIMIGAENKYPSQRPPFERQVKPFYLDKHPVTVGQYRTFVQETGYVTDAEKFGNAGVFNLETKEWKLMNGAYWEYPRGKNQPKAKEDHPVTQVSWRDAMAYCRWAQKRLPTEFEWEYAAKNGGKIKTKYPWGDEVCEDEKYFANVWQGDLNTKQGDDGFVYTSPVGHYGETPAGLTDMAGNVWEWCSNEFDVYPKNPQNYEPRIEVRSIRGGSFFYDHAGNDSYTTTYRAFNTWETSLFNLGFRCAKNIQYE